MTNVESGLVTFETPEQSALREVAREFADREIRPYVRDYDRDERFPREIVEKTAELGWIGAPLGPEYEGANLDWVSFAILIEEISRACHIVALALSMPTGLVGAGILQFGTEEQRQKYLVPLVRGEGFAGAGVTEPGSGTDVANMATTYRRDGDEYVIDGAKAWTSMLGIADWFITFATADRALGRSGVSAFIVPADAPGVTVRPYKNKLGFRPLPPATSSSTGSVCPSRTGSERKARDTRWQWPQWRPAASRWRLARWAWHRRVWTSRSAMRVTESCSDRRSAVSSSSSRWSPR